MCKLCFTPTLRELIALSTFSLTAKLWETETNRQAQHPGVQPVLCREPRAQPARCIRKQKTLSKHDPKARKLSYWLFPTQLTLPRVLCLSGGLHGRENYYLVD